MTPPLDRDEWEVLLRAKLRLKPSVTLHVEEGIRRGEVAPAGLAYDAAAGKTYSLAPWHCHFMHMMEGGCELEETVRVVIAFFPAVACRERIREFVCWLESKNLAEVEWPHLRLQQVSAQGNAADRPDRSNSAGPAPPIHANAGERKRKKNSRNFYWGFGTATAAAVVIGFVVGNLFRVFPGEVFASASENVTAKQVAPKLAEAIPVRAAAPGILTEVLVRDGDRIAKGDVVARIQDAEALKTLEELRRELGEFRVRRDEYYRAGNWDTYIEVVRTIVKLSQKIGEMEAASRPVDLRSPVSGEVETDRAIGRAVGEEIGGGELIFTVLPR